VTMICGEERAKERNCPWPVRLGLGLLLTASAAHISAAQPRNPSSSMLMSVEVVRPATVHYSSDGRGALVTRVAEAEARISTTKLTSVGADQRSTRSPSDRRPTMFVEVEY
jgi:hypothetical protein